MRGHDDPSRWSHVRVATKYPEITRRHFAARGVQAECIKLNGAMELAPQLGLCRHIVDLVQTGATLKANGLVEIEQIAEVTSRLIVNRAGAEDPRRGGRPLDRALPRGRRCRLRSTPRATGFAAAFAALLAAKREIDGRCRRRGRRDHRRCRGARRCGADRATRSASTGSTLTPATLRVLAGGDRRGGAAVRARRRSRRCGFAAERIEAFHRRQLPARSRLRRRGRRAARRALAADRRGRALRAGRHRRLSLLGADERDPGQGRRGRAAGR